MVPSPITPPGSGWSPFLAALPGEASLGEPLPGPSVAGQWTRKGDAVGEVVDAHVLEEEVVVSCTVRASSERAALLLVRQGWCGVVGCPCCVVTQVDDPPTPVPNYSSTLVARSTLVSTLVPWSGGAAGSPGLRATAKVPWSGDLPIPRRVRGSLEVCRSPEVRWSQETPLLLLVHGDVEVDEDEELEDEDEGWWW